MNNGISTIGPIPSDILSADDMLIQAIQRLSGGGDYLAVSGSAAVIEWQLFDPEQVQDPSSLPEHWLKVFNLHFDPKRIDCRKLRFRYVHAPVPIIGNYPRAPRVGIFCLHMNRESKITASDLVYIEDDLDEIPGDKPTKAAFQAWENSR